MKSTRIILATLTVALSMGVSAQNQLKELRVTNITPELSVYPCGDRQEALVVLRCQEPFDLVLSSNYDADLNLSVTTEGPEKVYSIVFKTKEEGTSFKGRQLTIVAEGFKKHYIPLNLNTKEKLEFLVSDPYSKLRSLFYTATESGLSLFTDGMYDAAIDQFNIAKQCPEYPETENHLDTYIEQCNNLKNMSNTAQMFMDNEDYFNARMTYLDMMKENPNCTLIRDLYMEANDQFNRVSKHDMEVAQAYFDTKRYEEARSLYEHAIAQNNPQSAQAGINLSVINLKRYKSDNHTRSLSYVTEPNCKIGLMAASLKPDKAGAYFSFSFDKGAIDVLSRNLDPITTPNFTPDIPMYQTMVSAGWTIRLYTSNENQFIPKVWALATPFSYAGGGFYTKLPQENSSDSSSSEVKYDEDYHWMNVLAPEAGIAVRVWRVVLSYRYQYRYVLNKEKPASDNLGKSRNLLGIGFCW